jgi:hypothetical protein
MRFVPFLSLFSTLATASQLFYVLEPHPDKDHYNQFYANNKVRLVSAVTENSSEVESAQLFVLGAKLSSAFKNHRELLKDTDNENPLMHHNGIGFILYDKYQKELYRLSASFWACLPDRADSGFVKMHSNRIEYLNRAVVAYAISHGDWEDGYWTESVYLETFSVKKYKSILISMNTFATSHPYLAGYELWTSDNELLSPAVTCNTFVQEIVWKATRRDVFKEQIIFIGYSTSYLKVNETMDKENFRIVSDMHYIWPRWYDEHGVLLSNDVPEIRFEFASKWYLRNNAQLNIDFLSLYDAENRIIPYKICRLALLSLGLPQLSCTRINAGRASIMT